MITHGEFFIRSKPQAVIIDLKVLGLGGEDGQYQGQPEETGTMI